MTDTERLDFIQKHKVESYYVDLSEEFVIVIYKGNGRFLHLARNTDLRTAIDEAMQEMRGLRNEKTV